MTQELTFKTNGLFEYVTYDKDADSWYFVFEDNIAFSTQTIWRLLKNKNIQWVSLDNGQQFGLPAPVNLVEKLTSELTDKRLVEIKVKQDTADLLLSLSDNLEIEIFISSSGYESYNFSVDKKNYIGMGSGDIAIFDNE
jgi:hypothetical protein